MGGENKRKGDGGGGGEGPNKKKFYVPNKGNKGHASNGDSASIPRGSSGILVTVTGGKEFLCAREIAGVLTEYHERAVDDRRKAGTSGADAEAKGGAADISKELASELAGLKDKKGFFLEIINPGLKGLMFLKVNPDAAQGVAPDPAGLVGEYLKDVAATKETRSRWIARLFPAEDVSFAGVDEIKDSVAKLATKHFPLVEGAADGSLATYAIVYEHRAAPQALERNALIEAVAQVVPKSYKVDLKAPQKVILLQVVKNVCCVSIVNDWIDNHKFNVRRCAGLEDDEFGKAKKPQNAGKGTEKKEEDEEK